MTLLEYLFKFSLGLTVLYIFYYLVLRPLTFYQWNRFFLLVYSLLAFVLPFLNISPWLPEGMVQNQLLTHIPAVNEYAKNTNMFGAFNWQLWTLVLFCTGMLLMFVRIILQFLSLRRIQLQSELMYASGNIRLYETVKEISPFSFGNAIYINTKMHSEEELHRIIQHEIVHVRQQHTIDIAIGELICLFNWYNPFAWLIRKAIRQNLEFIADNNVLAKGHDKKEYQYLLLKVIGVPQYSIANNFNLPDLKKRIAMMNKMKSAKIHLAKFLFALPLAVLILLAFRNSNKQTGNNNSLVADQVIIDTTPVNAQPSPDPNPMPPSRVDPKPNKQGYIVTIANDNNECVVLIRDRSKKIVKALPLTEWNERKTENQKMYGVILTPPPPPPPIPPVPPVPPVPVMNMPSGSPVPAVIAPVPPVAPIPPASPDITVTVKSDNDEVRIRNVKADEIGLPVYVLNNTEVNEEVVKKIDKTTIEYVNVIKGEPATKAYGKRGKFGVVEIKTKPEIKK